MQQCVVAFSVGGAKLLPLLPCSCAGMTAKVTIIAQTRIGFLSGLRRFSGGEGAEEAYDVQMEEVAPEPG